MDGPIVPLNAFRIRIFSYSVIMNVSPSLLAVRSSHKISSSHTNKHLIKL